MTIPGRFGTFVLGHSYSYLGEGGLTVIEPYPVLHVKPVLFLKEPNVGGAVRFDFEMERVNGFTGNPGFVADELPAGVTEPRFVQLSSSTPTLTRYRLTLDVASNAPHQGGTIRLRAILNQETIAQTTLLLAIAPDGFCVVDGLTIPVTEAGFQTALEVLGDKARARDGTLQSTVRGVKRSWTFQLEMMEGERYAAYARHLFTDLNRVRLLSGTVVAGEALAVLMTPREPDIIKTGSGLIYRLKGQIEER